jgi:GT2 family glycosyltransferase
MVTIIILVGRDQNNLERLYESIVKLTKLPTEIILVVDEDVVLNFEESKFLIDSVRLVFLYTKNKKLPEMRNLGIQSATSEYLWFIDDDVTLNFDSLEVLENILISLNDNSIGCIAGRIIESKDFTGKLTRPIDFTLFRGFIGDFSLENSDFPSADYKNFKINESIKLPVVPFAQGTSMVFNKIKLLSVGGFDEDLSYGYCSFEDADPCLALYRKGYKTIYASEVVLTHHKMIRVGGVTRGYDNFLYQSSIVRNFLVVIFKNKYPNILFWPVYILTFTFFHYLRLLYSNNFLKFNFNSLKVLSKSTKAVLRGFYLGFITILKNKSRVNTQINQ